jgi:hypothetical protein
MWRVIMKKLFIVIFTILLLGCATSDFQNYQGSSDARYGVGDKYEQKFEIGNEPNSNKCIEKNKSWEIWLEDLKINQLFEGNVERSLDNNNLNELAVFVNIKERVPGEAAPSIVVEDLMLSYKEGVGINIPPNEDDALIYAGTYNGNDIILEVKVIEYDDQTKESLSDRKLNCKSC